MHRIRESVGATHHDMAHILKAQGMASAMGFDPGGSATLMVGTKTVNVSPHNSQYLQRIYAAPPEPGPVANAVIGALDR
ncbi:phosphodiester glycosidase family protein [Myxococcota bacterium]